MSVYEIEVARMAAEQRGINAERYLADAKARIRKSAAERHAEYEQYEGYWAGDEWKLGRATRRTEGKGGISFEPGDYALFRETELEGEPMYTAYSIRRGNNVIVNRDAVAGMAVRHAEGLVYFEGVYG